MTRVKMLKTFRISPDGLRVETWGVGSVREVSDHVMGILIAEGACEIIDSAADGASPENKMLTGAKPRKRRGRK